ncbi:hypothetical protein CUR49_00140, partial [Enterococcus faecalis]
DEGRSIVAIGAQHRGGAGERQLDLPRRSVVTHLPQPGRAALDRLQPGALLAVPQPIDDRIARQIDDPRAGQVGLGRIGDHQPAVGIILGRHQPRLVAAQTALLDLFVEIAGQLPLRPARDDIAERGDVDRAFPAPVVHRHHGKGRALVEHQITE